MRPGLPGRCARRLLECDPEFLFSRTASAGVVPRREAILSSLVRDACGEAMMESRSRRLSGKALGIPCFLAVEQKI